MMSAALHILARGDDDWTKVIGGLVFIAFWAISAISQWVNKQKKAGAEARRREMIREQIQAPQQQQPIPRVQPKRPVRISESIARRFPEVLRPPRPVARKPLTIPKTRKQRATPPSLPPVVVRAAAPAAPAAQSAALTSVGSRSEVSRRPAAPGAGAPAIAKWLTPRTLRQQFILTEIFQPPLAMREKRV